LTGAYASGVCLVAYDTCFAVRNAGKDTYRCSASKPGSQYYRVSGGDGHAVYELCDASCASCSGPSSRDCGSCASGYVMLVTQSGKACVSTQGLSAAQFCSSHPGFALSADEKTCTECDFFNNLLDCKQANCVYNPYSDPASCGVSCNTGYTVVANTCTCDTEHGYYMNEQSVCTKCNYGCATCSDGKYCTSCAAETPVKNYEDYSTRDKFTCVNVSGCDEYYFAKGDSDLTCTPCSDATEEDNICGTGACTSFEWDVNSSKCVYKPPKCTDSQYLNELGVCTECTDVTDTSCQTKCSSYVAVQNGDRSAYVCTLFSTFSSDGYYVEGVGVYGKCFDSCATCNGPSSSDCLSCPASHPIKRYDSSTRNQFSCVTRDECGSGFFLEKDVCDRCGTGCSTCSDAVTCDTLNEDAPLDRVVVTSSVITNPSGALATATFAILSGRTLDYSAGFDNHGCVKVENVYSVNCPISAFSPVNKSGNTFICTISLQLAGRGRDADTKTFTVSVKATSSQSDCSLYEARNCPSIFGCSTSGNKCVASIASISASGGYVVDLTAIIIACIAAVCLLIIVAIVALVFVLRKKKTSAEVNMDALKEPLNFQKDFDA